MSQWSAYQSPRTSRAPQQARDVARKVEPRQSAAKPPAAAKTSGYTFAHAGRQIRLGPLRTGPVEMREVAHEYILGSPVKDKMVRDDQKPHSPQLPG